MKVLMTGGSGDLGCLTGPTLERMGHSVTNLDLNQPLKPYGEFVSGSILDRPLLNRILPGIECIIHIAALHGIHEFRRTEDRYRFWDVNVTGTFNVLQAAKDNYVRKFVFISSTSVEDTESFYGITKVFAEELCVQFSKMDKDLSIIRLRPRAFIPPWNKEAYKSFVEWAHWFWSGAVHISDVEQAVVKSVALLEKQGVPNCPAFVIDGKYDYSVQDLAEWDKDGPGSTFRKHYPEFHDLAIRCGFDPSKCPTTYDITSTRAVLGYSPSYSLRNLLEELQEQALAS